MEVQSFPPEQDSVNLQIQRLEAIRSEMRTIQTEMENDFERKILSAEARMRVFVPPVVDNLPG
jgi:hypothetical protein